MFRPGIAVYCSLALALLLTVSSTCISADKQPVPACAPTESAIASDVLSAIDKVKPSLVRLLVVAANYRGGREVKYVTAGSGVIISDDGYVVTNHHVAGRAKQVVCTLADKTEIPADLVATDPLADIAVVKLRGEPGRKFPYAGFGDSSCLKVGDRVFAMGSPYALSQSVTMGIVSNTELVMPDFLPASRGFILEGENVGSVVRWIGHDAPIYGGNSGGPLVNPDGEIIGINEINIGISGAIPGNLARDVAQKLISTGGVPRSWTGIEIQPLLKHDEAATGALVAGVIEGSPADKAGMKPGDILVSVAGSDVNVRFAEEVPVLNQAVMGIPVGETAEFVVVRGTQKMPFMVTTTLREHAIPDTVELTRWGMTSRNLSMMDARERDRKTNEGVMVTSVRAGGASWESKPKLDPGDVIVGLDGRDIKDVESLASITGEIMKDKTDAVPVLVTLDKGKERCVTVVKLRNKDVQPDQGVNARKAWLAVKAQVITKDIAEGLGMPGTTGVRITRVFPGKTADKAGITVGDLILSINGETVTPYNDDDNEVLEEMVKQYPVGSTAELSVLRGKDRMMVQVTLDKSPKPTREMKRYIDTNFEFTVRDVAFLDELEGDDGKKVTGALVESVSEGGWASLAMLAIGDVIEEVDGMPVANSAAFEQEMAKVAGDRPDSVVFKVKRGIHTLYIELEPEWPELS